MSDPQSPFPITAHTTPPLAVPDPRGWRWLQVGLLVALLAISAGARAWQSSRVDEVLREGRVAPFRLHDVPMTIGSWVGKETTMDPEVARITGATEIVSRNYTNQTTGQRVAMLFLFGPSTGVSNHSPEICYPSNGYRLVHGPDFKLITGDDSQQTWPFLASDYTRGDASASDTQEVYWTWRYENQWTPALVAAKGFERIPGMFKVHVDRPIRAAEINQPDVGNPCKEFLSVLMPIIDRMILESGDAVRKSTSRVGG